MPIKLFKDKRGRFVDYFKVFTPANLVFTIVLALVVTYFINFILNQTFGTKIILLGQPLRFLLIGLSIVPVFYVVIKKQGALERQDIFAILLIEVGIFALIYYLPQLVPEMFSKPSTTTLSILNSLYTNPNSPVNIWYNASVTLHNTIQSAIPIP